MRGLLLFVLCSPALAVPHGRRLRPEERWRRGEPRDPSKYQPRALWAVDPGDSGEDWAWLGNRETRRYSSPRNRSVWNGACGEEGPVGAPHSGGQQEGPPAPHSRIVGGQEARPNQWPWMVALFIDNAWFCGGTIISSHHILTAAHCVASAHFFDVVAGAHNHRDSEEPHRVEITSYSGTFHPDWDPSGSFHNDVALVELPEPLPLSPYIAPVCLPQPGDTAQEGDLCTALGWGSTADSAPISDVLMMAGALPVISNSACNAVYGIVTEGMVCIGTEGGRGTCSGDSGGPLMKKAPSPRGGGEVWQQQGVVSFGSALGCQSGNPDGFSRTEYYLDWILSEIS